MFNHTPVELGLDQVLPQRLAESERGRAASRGLHDSRVSRMPLDLAEQVIRAVASYVRTLISATRPFDRYLYWGDERCRPTPNAAWGCSSPSARNARYATRASIYRARCASRSARPQPVFHNTGLYNLGGTGRYPDTGLIAQLSDADMGRFARRPCATSP